MKVDVLTITNTAAGKKDLPEQFSEPVRQDLVKRAVEVIQSNRRQPYGAKSGAGMRYSAKLSRRRRDYKTSYGIGISRVPRKILSHQGTRFNWVGAFAPGTVGGRRSHPPKEYKLWDKKINKSERRKAIRSALAATMARSLVEQRGHIVPKQYPFIIESKLETLHATREVMQAMERLGLADELQRAAVTHVRAGRGKNRGRPYQHRKGPLVVVSNDCPLLTIQNIPGIDVVRVDALSADILAPGADVGRLTLFTDAAIDRLAKEGLYTRFYHGPSPFRKEKNEAPKAKKPSAEKAASTVKKTPKAAKAVPEQKASQANKQIGNETRKQMK